MGCGRDREQEGQSVSQSYRQNEEKTPGFQSLLVPAAAGATKVGLGPSPFGLEGDGGLGSDVLCGVVVVVSLDAGDVADAFGLSVAKEESGPDS